MQLDHLRVVHYFGDRLAVAKSMLSRHRLPSDQAFMIDTCQRIVLIGEDTLPRMRGIDTDVETFEGVDAYAWILSFFCGLRSQVAGETEVFSQVKQAWQAFSEDKNLLSTRLGPWIQKLFSDTKEIRAQFLQGIGGASYGSLVRKLLDLKNENESILILGAGQIAEAIVPYIERYQLRVWNRSMIRLNSFLEKFPKAKLASVSDKDLADAIKHHSCIVICIPSDLGREAEWNTLRMSVAGCAKIVHLGAHRWELSHWSPRIQILCLDDLYELQRDQDELKGFKIKRAKEACEERAKLRHLSDAIVIGHGWEDLSHFSC